MHTHAFCLPPDSLALSSQLQSKEKIRHLEMENSKLKQGVNSLLMAGGFHEDPDTAAMGVGTGTDEGTVAVQFVSYFD